MVPSIKSDRRWGLWQSSSCCAAFDERLRVPRRSVLENHDEQLKCDNPPTSKNLDGNAGVAAKAIITCFGQDSLSSFMSAGLTLADGGSTVSDICELVAGLGYIESIKGISTNSSFVDFIFENVVGRSPNFLESAIYTTYLDNGVYTKGSLLTLAAGTALVDQLLTESAVDLIGVPGSADGEILALQYDIGLG